MIDGSLTQLDAKSLREILKVSLQLVHTYDWLIDAYVLDFYVNDNWSQLPNAWRKHLEPLDPEYLANILRGAAKCKSVRPLSVLCLIKLLNKLCVSRVVVDPSTYMIQEHMSITEHPKLKNIFTKCVKPKKRHEISKMARMCYNSVTENHADFIVDFGAGLGHLARVLGYGYGVQVCCLEKQNTLNEQARVIDAQLETIAAKFLPPGGREHFRRPIHVTLELTKSMLPKEFVDQIIDSLAIPKHTDFSFGIIGLHPCGDLGAILMDMFLSCKQAKFLCLVGCCYMKLSESGYPLSDFLKNEQPHLSHLSYESREIACHASEVYCDRLESGNYEDLKVHSFRATTERIMQKYWPELKHTGLRNVRHAKGMSYENYVERATKGLNIHIPKEDVWSEVTRNDLDQWKRIVIFYTMRLLFAPLVETIVLYDRLLYLKEKGCSVDIAPIFDPRLSPRNHITRAVKPNQ